MAVQQYFRRIVGACGAVLAALPALAQEAPEALTEHAPEAAEHKAGMPQLDPTHFASQIFWLVVSFVLLYVLMSRVALPRIASVIEQRDHRIKSDLDRAEKVKADADAALATYQKTMADARAKAQAELRQGQAAIAAETAKRDAEFGRQLAERARTAEDSITQAKVLALADLRGVGADVAGSVLAKVAGLSIPPAQVQAAVDAAMTER